ncbi:MAG: hypothetical protein ACRDZO_03730 [Egibacteraceae bacterium]
MATFLLLDGPSTADDLLGLWRDDPAAVAFDSRDTADDVQVWQADLPVDAALAYHRVRACEARLRRSSTQLEGAADRLGGAIGQYLRDPSTAMAPIVPAEVELAAWLKESGKVAGSKPDPGVAFAAAEPVLGWWEDVSRDLEKIAGLVARACHPRLLAETRVGGELIGRSRVGLLGDVRTVLRADREREAALLHRTTVALVLSTRATLLRAVAVVAQGAVEIAVRLALPGGPLLAVPAAWRFIQRVLHETGGGVNAL